MKRPRHSLTLVARGPGHLHPWLPTCACNWRGIPGRRRFAVSQYRGHVNGIAQRSRLGPAPRALTPTADLPEELR